MAARCRLFTYGEIKKATNNFADLNVIGEGGEGKVYKGTLPDGLDMIHVAVKYLKFTSNEFKNEIDMLSNLHHANLVSLIGYCQRRDSKILVYKLMVNGSLHDSIYKEGGCSLTWNQRLKICIGAARGLEYLHTGTSTEFKIIHRDVKPSNILLDENFNPKISDFGLSRKGPANQTRSAVNTAVKGTLGYYAPEYFPEGQITIKVAITIKVDVYAFGLVLFEVLCGKSSWERLSNVSNVRVLSVSQWASENIDKFLDGNISTSCLKVFIDIAEKCLNTDPFQRPTMSEVVSKLEDALKLQKCDFEAGKSAMMLGNPYRKILESAGASGSNNSRKYEKTSEQHEHGFVSSKGSKLDNPLQQSDTRRTESGKSTKISRERASGSSQTIRQEGTLRQSIGRTEPSKSGNTSSRTKPKAGISMTRSRSTLLDMPSTERKIVLYSSGEALTDCNKIRLYLKMYGVESVDIEERDPTTNVEYEAELRRFFSRTQRQYCLPQLFIGGKYIGGAEEVDSLFCAGELGKLLSELNQVQGDSDL